MVLFSLTSSVSCILFVCCIFALYLYLVELLVCCALCMLSLCAQVPVHYSFSIFGLATVQNTHSVCICVKICGA